MLGYFRNKSPGFPHIFFKRVRHWLPWIPPGFLLTRTLEAQRLLGRAPAISSVMSNHAQEQDTCMDYLYIYIVHMHTCKNIYMYIYIYMFCLFLKCMCMYIEIARVVNEHVLRIRVNVCMWVYEYMYIYTHIHLYTYIYIYMLWCWQGQGLCSYPEGSNPDPDVREQLQRWPSVGCASQES